MFLCLLRLHHQVVNGVTVQPGVYIDGLKVQDGSITNPKLGNGVVDDLKISSVDVVQLIRVH